MAQQNHNHKQSGKTKKPTYKSFTFLVGRAHSQFPEFQRLLLNTEHFEHVALHFKQELEQLPELTEETSDEEAVALIAKRNALEYAIELAEPLGNPVISYPDGTIAWVDSRKAMVLVEVTNITGTLMTFYEEARVNKAEADARRERRRVEALQGIEFIRPESTDPAFSLAERVHPKASAPDEVAIVKSMVESARKKYFIDKHAPTADAKRAAKQARRDANRKADEEAAVARKLAKEQAQAERQAKMAAEKAAKG